MTSLTQMQTIYTADVQTTVQYKISNTQCYRLLYMYLYMVYNRLKNTTVLIK